MGCDDTIYIEEAWVTWQTAEDEATGDTAALSNELESKQEKPKKEAEDAALAFLSSFLSL